MLIIITLSNNYQYASQLMVTFMAIKYNFGGQYRYEMHLVEDISDLSSFTCS